MSLGFVKPALLKVRNVHAVFEQPMAPGFYVQVPYGCSQTLEEFLCEGVICIYIYIYTTYIYIACMVCVGPIGLNMCKG